MEETMRFPAWREVEDNTEPSRDKQRETTAIVAGNIVSHGLISTVTRSDTPPDSGYGLAMVSDMEADTSNRNREGVSYAGEVPAIPRRPEPGFKPFPTMP